MTSRRPSYDVEYIEREPSRHRPATTSRGLASYRPDPTSYSVREIPHTRPHPIMRRESDSYDWKEPSYYGPDFQNVEKGLSSSFSLPRRKVKEPIPYVKRPDPYPPHVERQYNYYKNKEEENARLVADFYERLPAANQALRMPRNQTEALSHESIKSEGKRLLRDVNEATVARAGFIQKFPYAYRHFDDENHWTAAEGRMNQAMNLREKAELAGHHLRIYETKQKGDKPKTGLSKEEYQRQKKEKKSKRF